MAAPHQTSDNLPYVERTHHQRKRCNHQPRRRPRYLSCTTLKRQPSPGINRSSSRKLHHCRSRGQSPRTWSCSSCMDACYTAQPPEIRTRGVPSVVRNYTSRSNQYPCTLFLCRGRQHRSRMAKHGSYPCSCNQCPHGRSK